jgi:hypothetical protein
VSNRSANRQYCNSGNAPRNNLLVVVATETEDTIAAWSRMLPRLEDLLSIYACRYAEDPGGGELPALGRGIVGCPENRMV